MEETPGRYLKQMLKQKGLTQQQVARMLGVERSLISQWCTGVRPIPPERALALEQTYGLDAERLCPRVRMLRRLMVDPDS